MMSGMIFGRCLISICWMLIGQFVLGTGCGCQARLSRKCYNVQSVFVQSGMDVRWTHKESTSSKFIDLYQPGVHGIALIFSSQHGFV